ncbi:MAG: ATP-binding cassette domain-containing protein, partial [Pelagibacterales bacterium]|nr:ATP-binding cassette domain-containing protein [Pelagibacterales bacterium]
MSSLIELKNISKYYIDNKKTVILKKINFKFKKGLIYSLVGPSGSGKSTLLNLLSLIDKPSSGEIIINNNSTKYNDISQNDQLRADKIGIIYQQNNLLPDFNALE